LRFPQSEDTQWTSALDISNLHILGNEEFPVFATFGGPSAAGEDKNRKDIKADVPIGPVVLQVRSTSFVFPVLFPVLVPKRLTRTVLSVSVICSHNLQTCS
jgi:hypothetical protein